MMDRFLLWTVLFLLLIGLLVGCGFVKKRLTANGNSNSNSDFHFFAEQIKISDLSKGLEKLRDGRTEFDFIGITSNGVDCIYFMPNNDKFDIDFEAVMREQLPYMDKLRSFADQNSLTSSLTTYGNEPIDHSTRPAPVLHIEASASLDNVAQLGEKIESEVFGNGEETLYDIVP
jgi:hypothetical protein